MWAGIGESVTIGRWVPHCLMPFFCGTDATVASLQVHLSVSFQLTSSSPFVHCTTDDNAGLRQVKGRGGSQTGEGRWIG